MDDNQGERTKTMIVGVLVIIAAAVVLFLYCVKPNTTRRQEMAVFEKQYIAHRGLFDNKIGIPENSIPAFRWAVENGYGIELDVQLTADHQMVVFHDESLKRMCGVDHILHKCTLAQLQHFTLGETAERIPLFEDVLKVIGGKVPLIVEVKAEGDWKATTKKMAEIMDGYDGVYCMESFHPLAVEWFRKNRPYVIRGQLSTNYFRDEPGRRWTEKFVLTNLLLNFKARPDFIAYNHIWSRSPGYALCRKLFDVENVAWTIRNQDELKRAKKIFQVIIFDSFIPDGDKCE